MTYKRILEGILDETIEDKPLMAKNLICSFNDNDFEKILKKSLEENNYLNFIFKLKISLRKTEKCEYISFWHMLNLKIEELETGLRFLYYLNVNEDELVIPLEEYETVEEILDTYFWDFE